MKKIFLLFLFGCFYKICTAQEFKISDEWNFLGIVSKIVSNNKLRNDTIITKLNAIRRYEKKGDTIKITTEETRYIVKNECWSRIKITGTLIENSSEKISPSLKDTLPKYNGDSVAKKINLRLNPEPTENAKGLTNVDIRISTPISISQNTSNSIIFYTSHTTCDIAIGNLRSIRANLKSMQGVDLAASDEQIFVNSAGFMTFEDDLRTPPATHIDSSKERRKLLVALNYTPQVAFDRVLIDEASFNDQSEVDSRTEQSRPIYGYNAGLSVGWWINNENRFSLNFAYVQMGFESKSSTIDWTTGYLYKEPTPSSLYHFKFWQAGINYAYVGNNLKKVNVIVDIGLSVNWKNHFDQNKTEIVNNSGFKSTVLAGNLGVGANINIARWLDLELVPNVVYTFTSVHTGYLRTYLHSAGITSRFVFNFFNNYDHKL